MRSPKNRPRGPTLHPGAQRPLRQLAAVLPLEVRNRASPKICSTLASSSGIKVIQWLAFTKLVIIVIIRSQGEVRKGGFNYAVAGGTYAKE